MDEYVFIKRLSHFVDSIQKNTNKLSRITRAAMISSLYDIVTERVLRSISLESSETIHDYIPIDSIESWISSNSIVKISPLQDLAYKLLSLPVMNKKLDEHTKDHMSANDREFHDPTLINLFRNPEKDGTSCYCDSVLAIMSTGTKYYQNLLNYRNDHITQDYLKVSMRGISIPAIHNTDIQQMFLTDGDVYMFCKDNLYELLMSIIYTVRRVNGTVVQEDTIIRFRKKLVECGIGETDADNKPLLRNQDADEFYKRLMMSIIGTGAVSFAWIVSKNLYYVRSSDGLDVLDDDLSDLLKVKLNTTVSSNSFVPDLKYPYGKQSSLLSELLLHSFASIPVYLRESRTHYFYKAILYLPRVFTLTVHHEHWYGPNSLAMTKKLRLDSKNDTYSIWKAYPNNKYVDIHLFAFLVQTGEDGQMMRGHYVCYIKVNRQWYYYDDDAAPRLKLVSPAGDLSALDYDSLGKITTLFFYYEGKDGDL